MGYTKDTVKGISWIGGFRGVTRVISLIRTVVLARLLLPSQFGVWGIISIVIAFVELLAETGINTFLIQESTDVDEYINTAWVISIIRGFIIAIVVFASAPIVAYFFQTPEVKNLLYLASLVPLLRGFINPSVVKFYTDIKFHKEFYYRTAIFAADTTVTIAIALLTKTTTSFVIGVLSGVIVEVCLSYVLASPKPSLSFEREKFQRVLHRGKWINAAGVFDYLFHNFDNVVIGKLLGTASLGFYDNAYKISMLPITEITDVVSRVTFPIYVKISDDKRRLKKAFQKTILLIILFSVPIGAILFIFPDLIIRIILGPRWLGVVGVLKVLAIFGVVRAVSNATAAIFMTLKKQNIVAILSFLSFVLLAIIIVPATLKFGIVGAATAALLVSVIILPVSFYFIYNLLYQ